MVGSTQGGMQERRLGIAMRFCYMFWKVEGSVFETSMELTLVQLDRAQLISVFNFLSGVLMIITVVIGCRGT